VPLAADVAPQLALFGAPAGAAPAATAVTLSPATAPDDPAPAFERRALLRDNATGSSPTCAVGTGAATRRSTAG
jgi:hypothetical protein